MTTSGLAAPLRTVIGEIDTAREYAARALESGSEAHDRKSEYEALFTLATCSTLAGNYPEALELMNSQQGVQS